MSYNPRPPLSGEIIVVPLAHPNGAYIRLDNNQKIPVLAKVRSGFSETMNVINFFGYIYNVPLAHIERINYNIDTKFYTDMIDNAQKVMNSFGYPSLDNSNFYDTQHSANSSVSYSVLSHLPGFTASNQSNVISPDPSGRKLIYQIDQNPPQPPIINISISNGSPDGHNYRDKNNNGSVSVMDINNMAVLHVITLVGSSPIIFDKRSGILVIPGYGTFIIDTSFTYTKTRDTIEYVILRSQKNYIHVRRSKIHFVVMRNNDLDNLNSAQSQYDVKTIRPKTNKPKYQKYFDIMKVIYNEFN